VPGAGLGAGIILILGVAHLLADGLSMAVGAYLSLKSEREYYDREREREACDVEHFPVGELAEMLELYKARGCSPEDAKTLAEIQSQDKGLSVGEMMVTELGLLPDNRKPVLTGAATFVSFLVVGSVPLLVYLLGLFLPIDSGFAFPLSIVLSGLALFVLGAAKLLITERNWFRSRLEMPLGGGVAAGVAYLVGYRLQGLVP
jgi:VIT1/CCC1 family predicted Fe2+/Mn2+ transporter